LTFSLAFKVGGHLKLILTVHSGSMTFPDVSAGGSPVTPVITS